MEDFNVFKSLNILYAEDDLVIRDSISRILGMFFKEVFVASDGIQTLEIYQKKKVNVLILDYVMPNLDGYETAKIIRDINKKIPIIIVSAYTDKGKLLNAIELNLIKYLEKPIFFNDLIEVFRSVVKFLDDNNLLLRQLSKNSYYSFISKNIITNNEEIILSRDEILFLELLLDKPNQLISKKDVEEIVFKESVDENTLQNMVNKFRKRLDEDVIVTIKDLGYLIRN